MPTREGHEPHGKDLPGLDAPVLFLFYEHELLGCERPPDRNDHPAVRLQLFDQRRRDMAGRCGNDDGVEGSAFLPPVVSVPHPDAGVFEPEPLQARLCRFAEFGDDLDGEDFLSTNSARIAA